MEPIHILAGLAGVVLAFATIAWRSFQLANILLTLLLICNFILVFFTVSRHLQHQEYY